MPSTVLYLTDTVPGIAWDSDTVNTAVFVPEFPSVTLTSPTFTVGWTMPGLADFTFDSALLPIALVAWTVTS